MTAASSSSSDGAAGGERPLVELRDLGVWFQLRGPQARYATVKEWLLGLGRREPRILWALRGVDLAAREGEALGVVGPNGAGKSTLCLALAGILEPDEGEAVVRGRVSALFSLGAGFNRQLSGRDNIELYGAFLGIPPAELEARTEEIVAFSELGAFADEPVAHYSDGMRARLAFSVAAALEPEVLLLDEVLGVGDRDFRAKSERRLRELIDRSRLIVVVSHNTRFLREVTTRCLWLEGGRVRRDGPTEDVLDAYEAEGPAASDRSR